MSWKNVQKVMDDISAFIKSFIEQLKAFIKGFKHDYDWPLPESTVEEATLAD